MELSLSHCLCLGAVPHATAKRKAMGGTEIQVQVSVCPPRAVGTAAGSALRPAAYGYVYVANT